MSNSDTLIVCGKCREHVPRHSITCPHCHQGLSSTQLRATVEKAASPRGWLDLAEERLRWLDKRSGPVQERLSREGRRFAATFDTWEAGNLPSPADRAPVVQAFSNWCGEVWKECKS